MEKIKESIRAIKDFPKEGILFRDLTTLFKEGALLKQTGELLAAPYRELGVTKVAGIESRGFVMGSIIATHLDAGFVAVRKPGKLPAETWSQSYEKEYGVDTVEIHTDAITEDDVVLLHDDLLATGGTMLAAYELVKRFNPRKVYINFIVELEDLKGRELFPEEVEIVSLITY